MAGLNPFERIIDEIGRAMFVQGPFQGQYDDTFAEAREQALAPAQAETIEPERYRDQFRQMYERVLERGQDEWDFVQLYEDIRRYYRDPGRLVRVISNLAPVFDNGDAYLENQLRRIGYDAEAILTSKDINPHFFSRLCGRGFSIVATSGVMDGYYRQGSRSVPSYIAGRRLHLVLSSDHNKLGVIGADQTRPNNQKWLLPGQSWDENSNYAAAEIAATIRTRMDEFQFTRYNKGIGR